MDKSKGCQQLFAIGIQHVTVTEHVSKHPHHLILAADVTEAVLFPYTLLERLYAKAAHLHGRVISEAVVTKCFVRRDA
jgi:hypothetical protein